MLARNVSVSDAPDGSNSSCGGTSSDEPEGFGSAGAVGGFGVQESSTRRRADSGKSASIPADRVRVEYADGRVVDMEVPLDQKIKGAAQMAGGAVMVAAGVPMCVLPGPGIAFVAGGAALASKGQRNLSGRDATPVEEKLDDVAQKLGVVAREQAQRAAHTAAQKAPEMAEKAARTVIEKGPEVAGKVAKTTVQAAPKVAKAAVKAAPKVAGAAAKAAKVGIGFISKKRSK